MKQLLAVMFLMIFSLQILPVKEIGSMLYKNQLTEEIHETDGNEDAIPEVKLKKGKELYQSGHSYTIADTIWLSAMIDLTIHLTEHYICRFIPDISTPPPNHTC